MISVVIIGYGNVGQHLHKAFSNTKNVLVTQIYVRNLAKINHLKNISFTDDLSNLKEADLYIIAVSDDAITTVSSQIKNKDAFVVHTSGSVSINSLKNNGRKGVFYPLQSFSKEKEINFDEVPFCLEAESKSDYALLEKIASSIGKKIYSIDSKQRQQLHVAAVFVNNFTNHLFKIGQDVCDAYKVPFEILHPLIQETVSKIKTLPPKNAQTGPAIRNDKKTIENHLELLNDEQQNIYKLLTKSIQNG